MKVKSGSEVVQSCPTLGNPMDCSLPGSSIHGIFQARGLEWGASVFSDKEVYLTKKWLGYGKATCEAGDLTCADGVIPDWWV